MRIENSLRNLKYNYVLKIVSMLLHLITRVVFIMYLNVELLGANSLFSNIIGILSFAELGIGSAISFSLYKPLEQDDHEKIKTLIYLYKKCYFVIGIIILVAGICLIPFLPVLTNYSTIENLSEIYILYLLITVVSYFVADKQSLLIADQKQFIVSQISLIIQFIQCLIQIIVIIVYKNFILYLVIQLVCQIGNNLILTNKTTKEYSYLKDKNIQKLNETDKASIFKSIKAMFMHKIGGVLVNNTDNLIVSSYCGLAVTGVASNYTLIISYANMLLMQVTNSTVASVGNLSASDISEEYKFKVFKRLDFINYTLYYFFTITLVTCLTPLIALLGKTYEIDNLIVVVLCLNFMISGYRIVVNQFKEVSGLFYYDRFKSIAEAIVNLVASIYLVNRFGLIGVYIGTTICQLTVGVWWEQKVLFQHLFSHSSSSIKYGLRWLLNLILVIVIALACLIIRNAINLSGILKLITSMLVSTSLSLLAFYTVFHKREEFHYVIDFIHKLLLRGHESTRSRGDR